MAVGLLQEMDQVTADMYDAVSAKLDVQNNPPAGMIFHSGGEKAGGGMRIFDVWESEDAYRRFEEERLRPAIMEVSETPPEGPPRQEFYELRDFVKP
ncbi:MAG TPA: hypothetical protein VIM22_06725 [Solirubrobacteraceae bacterium]|jgi:hypothetical protein